MRLALLGLVDHDPFRVADHREEQDLLPLRQVYADSAAAASTPAESGCPSSSKNGGTENGSLVAA